MPYRFRDHEGQVEEQLVDREALLKRCKDILMHGDCIFDPFRIDCSIVEDRRFLGWERVFEIKAHMGFIIGYSDRSLRD